MSAQDEPASSRLESAVGSITGSDPPAGASAAGAPDSRSISCTTLDTVQRGRVGMGGTVDAVDAVGLGRGPVDSPPKERMDERAGVSSVIVVGGCCWS